MKNFAVLVWVFFAFVSAENNKGPHHAEASLKTELMEVHPNWIRERCQEPFYSTKFQPSHNAHHPINNVTVLDVLEKDGQVSVKFSDETTCHFDTATIQAELDGKTVRLQSTVDSSFLAPHFWDRSLIAPPFFNHSDAIGMQDETRRLLSSLLTVGIAVIENVPREEGECTRFAGAVSFPRVTEWGLNFNVRSVPDVQPAAAEESVVVKKDLAYTSFAIGMHVDSPYRNPPPAFQLLHAIDHCHGEGCSVHNLFVDGFYVAEKLRKEDPEAFDLLCSVPLRWENDGGDGTSSLLRWAPVIELGYDNQASATYPPSTHRPIEAINFSPKSGGYMPRMNRDTQSLFYAAKTKFSAMLHNEENMIKVQLFPGALVVFDNRRVLHSRSAVLPTDGERWLQGCYMNRDGVDWLHERLRRVTQGGGVKGPSWASLKEATKEDCDLMGKEYDEKVVQKVFENLVGLLENQRGEELFLGAPVTLYHHGLQTASRALRAGEDDEVVVVSLFHDIMETVVVRSHGEGVAALLAPWISPKNQWMLAHHAIFQGAYYFHHYDIDPNTRDLFVDHPYYEYTVEWCEVCGGVL